MIRPTPRSLLLLGGGLPVAALPTVFGDAELWPLWMGYVGLFCVLLTVEFALLPHSRAVQVDLEAPTVLPFGQPAQLELLGSALRRVDCELVVACEGDLPPLPAARMSLVPGESARVVMPLRPERRGTLRLTALHLRWHGALGLLAKLHVEPIDRAIQVVVDIGSVRGRVSRMISNREFQLGLKVERYIGDGTEFESLREFVQGMDHRAIDWKASARHRAVLCREFRAERAQSVMLCVDAGRLMGEPLAGVPRLDHAIRAALQLAFVCLRTGDRVGLFSFADRMQQLVLPRAGVHAMQAIQAQLAGLDYSGEESNFTLAMTQLLQQLRRRTMLVLFTDFVDSVTAELMLRNVHWLTRRHLLLFVALRDPLLDALVEREPAAVEDVHRSVVADEILRERRLVLERIRKSGAQVLDVGVEQLDAALIARYLSIKRRELL